MSRSEAFSHEEVCAAIRKAGGAVTRAARLLGCTPKTIYNYKNRYERVADVLEGARRGSPPNGLHSSDFKTALETPLAEGYDEAAYRDYLFARAKRWCAELDFPEPLKVTAEARLKDARIDLVVQHSASATVVEVKSQKARQGNWAKLRYMIPGQLLWYADLVEKTEVIPTSEVNLVAAIDWEPSARFRRMLGQVDPHIHILQP